MALVAQNKRGDHDYEEHDLRAALSERLHSLLPILLAHARRRLRYSGARGRDEAMALVDDAITTCWEGNRHWRGTVPLDQFLRGVIDSVASNNAKKSKRHRQHVCDGVDVDSLPGNEPPVSSPESSLVRAAYKCAEGDQELTDYLLTVLSDDMDVNRRSVAARLNWSADRVSVARKKLRRCLDRCWDGKTHSRRPS